MTVNIKYPFSIDGRGRVADTAPDPHIRQLIEQVLFTGPGERVNRPNFGSQLQQLLFSPNSPELAAATQFLAQGALEEWLGDLIHVEAVEVTNEESQLEIRIQYVVLKNQERQSVALTREF
ncbi:MAG: GPW/gp25 family protein [Cyanobacteria bacterium P01_H01_bin.26]